MLDMVMKLMKIILTMPATSAISERSFSALRHMKTWLRSTMNQTRLNWCMTLHIHNDDTDKLNIVDVVNEFVSRNSTRSHIFGRFVQDSFIVFYCFNLPQMHFKHPKISKFSGGACPWTPLAMPGAALPAGLPFAAKLAPPKQKSSLRPCNG